jgi:methylphosphotriester-DNA--protein-cysteine methyltransferase
MARRQAFWLDSSAWQFPNYDNADTFVNRLVRRGLLVREPVVAAALQGYHKELSLRSVQRRFLSSTGLSQQALYQIERARQATFLLRQGVSVLDTVYNLGYADQSHLIRALRRFAGQSPAQISNKIRPAQLSFLFNTTPFCQVMMPMGD